MILLRFMDTMRQSLSRFHPLIVHVPNYFITAVTFSLAIARIFGGFSQQFFEKYHEHLPKSEPVEQYELRVDLYELFHYLNHALLFGGVSPHAQLTLLYAHELFVSHMSQGP